MKPKITLCMIVKNETHVIERCLRSAAPFIDRYDITDTGSTDGTQDLIRKIMEELNVPGEVHQSDWKGFGDHAGKIGSRTEALQNAAKSDAEYAWMIDADDSIESGQLVLPENASADAYSLRISRGDFVWWRNQIFKLSSQWHYVGVLHEYAACKGNPTPKIEKLQGNYVLTARTEGARNVGITPTEKYSRDAEVLEEALKDDPDNARYVFYLAQSYFDSQQWDKSREAYQRRIDLGGWPEETFYSQYRIAIITGIQNKPLPELAHEFIKAYNMKPNRAEPLFNLARIYRMNGMPAAAFTYARMGLEIPYPENDILFIQDEVYRYGILDEVGASAFYAGKPHVGYAACKKLLDENLLPPSEVERVKQNLHSYEQVLSQQMNQQMQMQMNAQMEEFARKQKEKEEKKELKLQKRSTAKKSTRTKSIHTKYKSRKKK